MCNVKMANVYCKMGRLLDSSDEGVNVLCARQGDGVEQERLSEAGQAAMGLRTCGEGHRRICQTCDDDLSELLR